MRGSSHLSVKTTPHQTLIPHPISHNHNHHGDDEKMQRRRKTTREQRICSICSQSFANVDRLERHLRSHTGEKPHKCRLCGRAFARRYVGVHTRGIWNPEFVWLSDGTYRDSLQRHLRSHEKGTLLTSGDSAQGADGHETCAPYGISRNDSAFEIARSETTNGIGEVRCLPGTGRTPQQEVVVAASGRTPDQGLFDDPALGNAIDLNQSQYEWLPQWDMYTSLDFHCMEQLGVNWSGMSDSRADTRDEPPSTNECNGKPSNPVQKRWHTFIEDNTALDKPSGQIIQSNEIDDTCHRSLVDRLRPRVHDGLVPSTAFLVRTSTFSPT